MAVPAESRAAFSGEWADAHDPGSGNVLGSLPRSLYGFLTGDRSLFYSEAENLTTKFEPLHGKTYRITLWDGNRVIREASAEFDFIDGFLRSRVRWFGGFRVLLNHLGYDAVGLGLTSEGDLIVARHVSAYGFLLILPIIQGGGVPAIYVHRQTAPLDSEHYAETLQVPLPVQSHLAP